MSSLGTITAVSPAGSASWVRVCPRLERKDPVFPEQRAHLGHELSHPLAPSARLSSRVYLCQHLSTSLLPEP